jgi:bifunctional DNase/RNase
MEDAKDERDMLESGIWAVTQTSQGYAVMLRPLGEEMVIPIFIGPLEAQSILIGFDHIPVERPLTHDLFLNLMKHAGFAMLKAEVSALKDNIFFSRVCFCGSGYPAGTPLVLDARPSDALALAVRTGCPILTARKVLEQAGIMPDFPSGLPEIISGPGHPAKPAEGQTGKEILRRLRQELDRAVGAEEYEQAAKIRDKLILLAGGNKKPV